MKILGVVLVLTALLTALFAALGFAGNGDYKHALKQEAHYCEMVNAGSWPAYKESINCEGVVGL